MLKRPSLVVVAALSLGGCNFPDVFGPDGETNSQVITLTVSNNISGVLIFIDLNGEYVVKRLKFSELAVIDLTSAVNGYYSPTLHFRATGYTSDSLKYLGCDRRTVNLQSAVFTGVEPWGVNGLSLDNCGT